MKSQTIIFILVGTILMNILSIICLTENQLNLIDDFLLVNNLKICLVIYCGNGFGKYILKAFNYCTFLFPFQCP
jgi:hypothetical protein